MRDVYQDDERMEMYKTLDVLLRGGFHRAGVYCFWNPENREPFYIGVSNDLPERFAQHNSLRGQPGRGNKATEVNEWFSEHTRLGFSVVLQGGIADETYEPFSRNAEGQLLEGYKRVHGGLPPWNKIGASQTGAGFVKKNSAVWTDLMTSRMDSLIVARKTIRGLDEDASAEWNELTIHPARTSMMHFDGISDDAIRLALPRLFKHLLEADPSTYAGYDVRLGEYLQLPAPHPELS